MSLADTLAAEPRTHIRCNTCGLFADLALTDETIDEITAAWFDPRPEVTNAKVHRHLEEEYGYRWGISTLRNHFVLGHHLQNRAG